MAEFDYLNRQDLRLGARDAVLAALDEWARGCGLPNLPAGQEGAMDKDLPALFPALDAHVDRLIERSGFIMPDQPYAEAFLRKTAAELAASLRNAAQLPASRGGV